VVTLKEIIRFQVYEKKNGHCWWCGRKIAWANYGRVGERGAWEIDHNHARARGGTDDLRNLVPACVDCNRIKSDRF